MTNKQIISQLEDLIYEHQKIEKLMSDNKYEIILLIDKIKADATTTIDA